MAEPLALPIRVLVKGPSTVSWISWMGGPPSDLAYPRAIQAELHRTGRPADVQNRGVLGEPMRSWFPPWEQEILQFSPDVLVLSPCHYETVHLFLPHWFERHANKFATRSGRLMAWYRKRPLRLVWMIAVKLQGAIDSRLPARVRRGRMRRAVADLEAYLRHAQFVGSPLVLIMELLTPGIRQSAWFPGMAGRLEATNEAMRELVERLDQPHVRWFPTSEVARAMYGDDAQAPTPDGFHYTPELHHTIGVELAREIAAWADQQPHLAPEPAPAREPVARGAVG
ncbi:hypothetical protein [Nocardioides sp.]|uniref:hypothetical protein n=1 Tax=Nocardioides sp. TaxID=35761 RepID=UPI0027329A16|nr:hypothetical protein [Nocardioides sp.]MDP3892941.1 hypothetical protein [Nocardioides sp.]